jgi:hypothetical protein
MPTLSAPQPLPMSSLRFAAPLCALVLGACAAIYTPRPPLPIAEVVNLSKSGAPPDNIVQRIRQSGTTYALRGSDFAKLKQLGVPDPVLDHLQQSLVDDVDLLTRYWVLGEGLGACSFCYPQPVDIDKLQSGYGMVAASPPGRYQQGKPPGVPDWIAASLARPSAGPLTLDDVRKAIKDGVPEDQIVDRIRRSRLANVVGVGGLSIRTQPVAGLKGSELARLHQEGAGYAVLDALQSQFLAQWIETARLRYQNWGKGPGSMQ